jgi:hypothetical protein
MWKQPDENGRYPMSNPEYQALRALFGAKNALEQTSKDIERRVRLIPGGWRDFRMLVAVLDRLLAAVLRTVPQKKLLAIRAELSRTICEVHMQGVTSPKDDDLLTVVPQGALERVINEAVSFRCFGCERCDYKRCELFKAVDVLYHYDFPKTKTCPFADMTDLSDVPDEWRN